MLAPLLAAALLVPITQPKLTQAEAEARFFGSWLQLERIEAGKSLTDPGHLNGDCYGRDRTYSWGRRGELAAGPGSLPVRINATAYPMRVDFLTEVAVPAGQVPYKRVLPCIFKFQGGKLIIASPQQSSKERELKPSEDYQERPKDFASTKANGVTVEISKSCLMYDQD